MKGIIIGCPGAGKSHFGRRLQEKTGVPLYYLDCMFWKEDATGVSREELIEKQLSAMAQDDWLIDGNYSGTIDLRLERCDTVFFLDYPTELCLQSALSRRGTKRPDLPWMEPKEMDEEFRNYILGFASTQTPRILEALSRYPDKEVHIFRSRKEADSYLNTL